jgi:hypothetical protein
VELIIPYLHAAYFLYCKDQHALANPDVKQIDTPRHTITVDDYFFRTRLKKEINKSISALNI